jgi:hypothetical protein
MVIFIFWKKKEFRARYVYILNGRNREKRDEISNMQILDTIGKYTVTSEPKELSDHLHFYENCEDATGAVQDILVLQETIEKRPA